MARQKYFENWHGYSAEIPSRSKILLSSLHIAQFSRYKHFCVLQKLWKFKMATIFGETKMFVKTTAAVCISCRALKEKKQLFRDIHNFSFLWVKALPNVGEWVIWEKLAICNTFRNNSHLLILSRWIISYGSETSPSESSPKSRWMSYLRKIGYLQYF